MHNIYLEKAPNILLSIIKGEVGTYRKAYIFSNILKIFAKSGSGKEATFVSGEVVEVVCGDDGEGEEADHAAHQAEGQLVVQVAEQHRLHQVILPHIMLLI